MSVKYGRSIVESSMLPPVEFDFAETVAAGPAASLNLSIQVPAAADTKALARDLGGLVQLLSQLDRDWGGAGVVIDERASRIDGDRLLLVLRARDVRWSRSRFERMAKLLREFALEDPAGPAGVLPEDVVQQILDVKPNGSPLDVASFLKNCAGVRVQAAVV